MTNAESGNSSRNFNVLWIIVAFVLMVIGGFLFKALAPNTLPPEASAESKQVDNLLSIMIVIGGAIFLLVQGAIVFSVIRFRAKPGDTSEGITVHGNATLELIWTAIPAVIVLFLSIVSFQVWVSVTSAKENEQAIGVHAQRFAWSFTYDVPDHPDLTVTSKELHTFVDQPVDMVMNSTDVIHSFFIPAMRIKQDVIPGRTTEIRFTPVLAGEYPIQCAELCGAGHGDMRSTIIVHASETDYLDWFNQQVDVLLNPPEDPVARGEQILSSGAYPCSSCHTLESLGWTGNVGPNLTGVGDRAGNRVPGMPAEQYISRSIYFPHEFLVPGFGPLMPIFQHTDPTAPNYMSLDDHKAIVSYLCTQTSTGDSACDLNNLDQIISGY